MWNARWIETRWPCPRCGIRRTLRLGDRSSLCLNCKHQWGADAQLGAATPELPVSSVANAFSAQELRRLAVYRDAVRASFFTDEL